MKIESVIEYLDEETAESISQAATDACADIAQECQFYAGLFIAARNHMLGVSPEPKDEKWLST